MKIGDHIKPAELLDAVLSGIHLELNKASREKTIRCYEYLHGKIDRSENPIYGVNTGFGSLCNTVIPEHQLEELQKNLLISHACGMGDEVNTDIVNLMLVLKVLSLSKGHSGVQIKTVEKLLDLYNQQITPVVYEQGSLGASGDLAPLAHLSLPLIGYGEVRQNGEIKSADFLRDNTFHLKAKEGLALINGTQFMGAYGVYCIVKGIRLISVANHIAAMSADAFDARMDPFLAVSHEIRGQVGQQQCAEEILQILSGSSIAQKKKTQVQDPYSFRCIPQVHGASLDVLTHAEVIFEREINAVTDNPNIFPEEDMILSAGNFHGQTLALQLDAAAMAIAEIANISERRIYKLISGERDLPAFLIGNPGLNSGFMIPQYTAASIVSQNKQLCSPASVDSIVSSNGQEDHVSMGANAATKCLRVLENTISVLAIELIVAAQALEFRRPERSSEAVEAIHIMLRQQVPFIEQDDYMHAILKTGRKFLLEEMLR